MEFGFLACFLVQQRDEALHVSLGHFDEQQLLGLVTRESLERLVQHPHPAGDGRHAHALHALRSRRGQRSAAA